MQRNMETMRYFFQSVEKIENICYFILVDATLVDATLADVCWAELTQYVTTIASKIPPISIPTVAPPTRQRICKIEHPRLLYKRKKNNHVISTKWMNYMNRIPYFFTLVFPSIIIGLITCLMRWAIWSGWRLGIIIPIAFKHWFDL